jgi:hypothetical protein
MSDQLNEILDKIIKDLPAHALQVFVRGFEDKATVARDLVIAVLEGIGFRLKDTWESDASELGRLIETEITPVEELDPPDLEKIKKKVYEAAGDELGIVFLWQKFHMTAESEV